MKTSQAIKTLLALGLLAAGLSAFWAARAFAHCDTSQGPVIPEARAALEKGDVTPILKWIKPDNEAEIKAAFATAVAVRAQGPEAKKLADQYFLETLIRLHRAGEGAPYTGIKDEPVEPIVAMADKALLEGSPDAMIAAISGHMAAEIRGKFNAVAEAAKHKDKSVEAGREYVEAYVIYTHYVEGVHAVIAAPAAHHTEAAAPASEHKH